MTLRFPSSGGGGGGGRAMSHDMIRFTADDANNLAASMSPLRIVDPSTPGGTDYGVVSEHITQVGAGGSLCRHRARQLGAGDPSAWLDDAAGSPYAAYYCSCRREPRLRTTKTGGASQDDAGPAVDVTPPPDVAVGPAYGGASPAGVSRSFVGSHHPRPHVVVCTTSGVGDRIYQERIAPSCKYSTFLGAADNPQSRVAAVNALSIAMDGSGGSHAVEHPAAAAAADNDVTSSSSADVTSSAPIIL